MHRRVVILLLGFAPAAAAERVYRSVATWGDDGLKHAGVLAVAASEDCRKLVTGAADGTIKLWTLPDGHQQRVVQSSLVNIYSVAFSGDGGTIVTSGWDGTVRSFDVATGAPGWTTPVPEVLDARFSIDGGRVIASGHQGFTFIDAGSGAVVWQGRKRSAGGAALGVAPCPSGDCTIELVGVAGRPIHTIDRCALDGPCRQLLASNGGRLTLSADGQVAVVAGDTLGVYDLRAGRVLATATGVMNSGRLAEAQVSDDGRVAITSDTWVVQAWDLTAGRLLWRQDRAKFYPRLAPDGSEVSGWADRRALVLDVTTGVERPSGWRRDRYLRCRGAAPIAVAIAGATVVLRDAATGEPRSDTPSGPPDGIRALALGGDRVVTASVNGSVHVWRDGVATSILDDASAPFDDLAVTPDGRHAIVVRGALWAGAVHVLVLDLATGSIAVRWEMPPREDGSIVSARALASGEFVVQSKDRTELVDAAGRVRRTLAPWHSRRGKLAMSLDDDAVTHAVFTRNRRRAFSPGADYTIHEIAIADGSLRRILRGGRDSFKELGDVANARALRVATELYSKGDRAGALKILREQRERAAATAGETATLDEVAARMAAHEPTSVEGESMIMDVWPRAYEMTHERR